MAYIAIDIGHGSNTFPPSKGVYRNGRGYAEHDFNSRLGIELKKVLEKNGHRVIFGQQPYKQDVYLTMRTNLYNREKVDLVVSLHANYSSNKNVAGRCVFYWGTSEKSKRLAQSVRDEIGALGYSLHGNGLHAGVRGSWTNLHINRETKMPAILVEHGFMSHATDFELIFGNKTNQYVKDMAKANAKGIQNYLGLSFKEDSSKPVTPSGKVDAKLSFDEVVKKAKAGGYGNYPERAKNIVEKTNFTYKEIQDEINRRDLGEKPITDPTGLSLDEVIKKAYAGDYGNMPERKANIERLTDFTYDQVQPGVNRMAQGKSPVKENTPKLSFDIVVAKTKAGDYGNYPERKKNVEATGHSYEKVQAEVNKTTGASAKKTRFKVGDRVVANRLYGQGNSKSVSRSSSVVGYIETINNNWLNPYRLEKIKGRKNWLGFAKRKDLR